MKQNLVLLTIFSLNFFQCFSQSFDRNANGIKATIANTVVELQVYRPEIIRVLKWPAGKTVTPKSLSVIQSPATANFNISRQGGNVSLKTDRITAVLNLKNGMISLTSSKGLPLLQEKELGASFTPFNDAGEQTYSVSQTYQLDKDEAIYGLGILQRGKMSQRNQTVHMVQGNTEDYIPMFQSEKGYGIFWDNYSPTTFRDNDTSTSFVSEVGDCIDYYFIYGGDADGVVAGMRYLTGEVPMFPLWTYGYWQSKERYKSQDELVGVVKKYRELHVPLDGIIQDWQYWDHNYLWNAMDFLNPNFSNPQKMVDDVHKLNAHMIISIWSSFGPQTIQYRKLDSIGALMSFKTWPASGLDRWPPDLNYPSGVRVYDAFNPAAREIYWHYLNQGLFRLGIDGWWMDSSEPDHLQFNKTDLDEKTYLGPFRKVRNAFPLMTVGGVASHQKDETKAKRVFILTRSAFAGQQRYGANTWSGDLNSSWESLRKQVPAGLNFSLTGIPYWNSDIGGFFAGAYNKNWNDGTGAQNPLYQELYVRWLQFGAFTPMMRSHGTDVPREIYNFGKKGEPIYDAIEKIIHLRYRLLPYIYSSAWSITNNQSSMMRALFMDFADKKVRDMNNEYMFGKSILVAPVLKAQYTTETVIKTNENSGWDKNNPTGTANASKVDFRESKASEVYLPAGAVWYNFWTNEKWNGGSKIEQTTTISRVPLYIKAGSIVPIGPDVQFSTEKNWQELEIRVYEGADGVFTLYEDENDNYNYEQGAYSTISFKWNEAKKMLTIGDRMGNFPGMLTNRKFNIIKVAPNKGVGDSVSSQFDKQISYSGKHVSIKL